MDLRSLRYFVAVADERHFGRAAGRLHMTQPPLRRAIKQLENDLGTVLLHRSPGGIMLTAAGTVLYDEARTLLERAEQARGRVAAAAGTATITIGTLANSAEQAGTRLAAAFRQRHPDVHIQLRETDFADPTAGLRAGLVDAALTRAPFDDTGLRTHVLRSDPVGVVLRADDPLVSQDAVRLRDLADRRWFTLPEGTDPVWRAYWNGTVPADEHRHGPVVRTAHECVQAILWNDTIGLAPLGHALPEGVVTVPLVDMPPSHLVVAWNSAEANPLVHSFARIAASAFRSAAAASTASG